MRRLAMVLVVGWLVAACSQESRQSLRDGLTVPPGSELVGTLFPMAGSWSGVLEVKDDPLAVADDLARQDRELGGWSQTGSALCTWEGPNTGGRLGRLNRLPAQARAISCNGLWWGNWQRRGERYVMVGPPHTEERPPWIDAPPRLERAVIDDDQLPRADPPRTAGPGEEFGVHLPCAYDRVSRFRVPEGSRLVADFSGSSPSGFTAVLRTDDAEQAVRDLKRQAEGVDPELLRRTEAPHYVRVESPLGIVQALSVEDNAGGGVCTVTPSVNNEWVLVTAASD